MLTKFLHGLIIGIIISLILSLFYFLGLFSTWNTALSDNLFSQKTPRSDIVIIAIDDKSINAIGRWPWDRSIHAKLLNQLNVEGYKPKSIGFDVSFFEESNPQSDLEFAQALKNIGNVTIAAENNDKLLLPIDNFSNFSSYGIVNIALDSDGVSRRVNLSQVNDVLSFPVSIVEKYTKDYSLPNSTSARINFIGKPETFPYYSYGDVLYGAFNPGVFKDKIVLIGATAADLHDTYTTAVSKSVPMPGVEIHANTIQTLLNNNYLFEESKTTTVLTYIIIALVLSIAFSFLGIVSTIILTIISFIIYILYVIFSFDSGVIRNIVYPILAILLSAISNIAYKYLTENKQKKFIKKAFSYYLSEPVLNKIMSDPSMLKLGGERKEVTVLFSDIAGFTTISEKIDPEKLTHLLNMYLTEMTDIVLKNEGVLDKYIGDAVMAFWGAPLPQNNHALLACKTALSMYEKIPEIRRNWEKEGIENFDIRIGIHTGIALVGNMGSEKRFDYTVLGDTVNTASRLEGINKEYKTHITISEATYQKVKEFVKVRKLDVVKVKGKTKGVQIYELLKLTN